ncbi:thy-1 membrane glycoprotein [Neoarius graeffei]|uniref:thy-1 membrane glycoprotein n=1 Tax=Neoarius graeffei TaxID=443677 RepID=UPI00298BCA1A|nr:thy-1 membrane glycoprotein [Neoarius graeffei]XP_060768514.1 thy-1 membrane glycoprotein [Neoarius graeffei]
MMYYSILASVCLLGLASSQSIDTLTACLTKEQNLKMECKFTRSKSTHEVVCTYRINDKLAASTDKRQAVDDTYKNRATVDIKDKTCELHLTGFKGEVSELYNCTITQDQIASKTLPVEKKNIKACSAGNTLKHGGVILLLAFVVPLLSGML